MIGAQWYAESDMVLAAALHQTRNDESIVYRDTQDTTGVYLFTPEFPDYDRRMEVIALLARMYMQDTLPHLTLAR
jgi:hypothetical protein